MDSDVEEQANEQTTEKLTDIAWPTIFFEFYLFMFYQLLHGSIVFKILYLTALAAHYAE